MARLNLHANMIAEMMTAKTIWPVFLFEIEFKDETLYWNDSGYDVTSGHVWLSNGLVLELGDINENDDTVGQSFDITISGASEEINSLALTQTQTNKLAKIYLALFSAGSRVFVSVPYLIYQGKFDYAEIQDDVESSKVILHYETHFAKLDKPSNIRYTDESQQSILNGAYAGDRGFQYVKKVVDGWDGSWGLPQRIKAKKNKNQKNNPAKRTR